MIRNILIITAFPPNVKTAGQDYTRRLIEDLVLHQYNVDLIYAEYNGHDVEVPNSVNILKTVHPGIKNCIGKCWIHPFFSKRFTKEIEEYIRKISGNYDMLYFDFSQMHLYSRYVEHPLKVMLCHDVIYQKYSRKMRFLNTAWIKSCEKNNLCTAKQIITLCKKDADLIMKLYNLDARTVKNYLKTTRFTYPSDVILKDKMCFYGAWNRNENMESLSFFIKKIFPKLEKQREYLVIGSGMDLKYKEKIERIRGFKCVGFVEDPIKVIAECQAVIAPLHQGAGIKFKVLDALTAGTPVIGTPIAFEGIDDNEQFKLLHCADNEKDFIKILNNWENISIDYKQNASDEFCSRYNCNHFADIIDEL